MPTILALDTSTEACSAALLVDDRRLERFEVLPRGHAGRILAMLDELLAEAGIALGRVDALSFCRGPGSFTGVRIGCGVAQGVAFGADLPVLPLSTLAVLAQGARRETGTDRVLAAIDARMGEVYWAAYEAEAGLMRLRGEERVLAPGEVAAPAGDWLAVGTGWDAHGAALEAALGFQPSGALPEALPRAQDCLPLAVAALRAGEALPAEQALPVYLRDRVTG